MMIQSTVKIIKATDDRLKHKDVLYRKMTWWIFGIIPIYTVTRFMCFEDEVLADCNERDNPQGE